MIELGRIGDRIWVNIYDRIGVNRWQNWEEYK